MIEVSQHAMVSSETQAKIPSRFRKSDASSRDAALLLLRVGEIANDEIRKESPLTPERITLRSHISHIVTPSADGERIGKFFQDLTLPRCRSVSFCSADILDRPTSVSPLLFQGDENGERGKSVDLPKTNESILSLSPAFSKQSSEGKFVGTEVCGPIRGVLRKKFSWKTFPELENYLVEHRASYLQYSAKLNYTAEQKKYNNGLTQGLLDLAAQEGYMFEGFTFAMVRDRIRCYYKSYVQAVKKKRISK